MSFLGGGGMLPGNARAIGDTIRATWTIAQTTVALTACTHFRLDNFLRRAPKR